MLKRIGKCTNIDCENYNQEFEIDAGQEFVCPNPKCGQPLKEVIDKKERKKKKKNNTSVGLNWKLIGVAVIVLIGATVGVWKIVYGSNNPTEPELYPVPTSITLDKTEVVMTVGDKVVIVPKAEPEDITATFVFSVSSGEIDVNNSGEILAIKEGDAIVSVKCKENPNLHVNCNIKVKAKEPKPVQGANVSSDNTLTLSYGKYKGEIKNGYPHGSGKLTYTKARQINKYDSKARMAAVGDYVDGEFFNGFFISGFHYNSKNELIERITIGVGPEDSFESK